MSVNFKKINKPNPSAKMQIKNITFQVLLDKNTKMNHKIYHEKSVNQLHNMCRKCQ